MSSCILRYIYVNEFNYVEMIFQFWGLYFAVTKKPFLLKRYFGKYNYLSVAKACLTSIYVNYCMVQLTIFHKLLMLFEVKLL